MGVPEVAGDAAVERTTDVVDAIDDGSVEPCVEPPARGRGRPLAADRTDAILAAASELFDDLGYDQLRVQDIADRAGVGLATLYRRWPTKQALLAEALRRRNAGFRTELDGEPLDVLRTIFDLVATSTVGPKGEFLPGMYAYGSVLIERPGVRALPVATVTQIGNQTCCYLALNGKAVRTPVQTGVSDGTWVEVTGKLVRSASPVASAPGETWVPFDGSEVVIDGDLSEISDGVAVQVERGH